MPGGIGRRRFVYLAGAVSALGVAGCSEPSEEGEPPADDPPEGPVEDQNGDEDQEPGMGPARENGTVSPEDWTPETE